jgi:hypothetical protein
MRHLLTVSTSQVPESVDPVVQCFSRGALGREVTFRSGRYDQSSSEGVPLVAAMADVVAVRRRQRVM